MRKRTRVEQPDAASRPPATSRRAFLAGAAAAGAVVTETRIAKAAAAIAIPASTSVIAWRVSKVPVRDPGSRLWDRTIAASIEMDGQLTAPPVRPKPSVRRVEVRALHDREVVGFRLEWDDPEVDDLTVKSDQFRDACAVLLGPPTTNEAVRLMGTADVPVTLLHWKADWQRDVERGYQGLEAAFPRADFDFYPPLAPVTEQVRVPADYERHDATQWLPAYAVGNPIAQMDKPSAVEKLVARGFGSSTHQPTQNAVGRGVWRDGRWSVVVARPLEAVDDEEQALEPGGKYSMAVAVWAGQTDDAGGRKSPSKALLELKLAGW